MLLLYSYCIQNGTRTKWRPIPSVRFHMSDELNQTTVKRESDLFISRMITDRTGWHKVLLPINQNYDKFVKETRHWFYIFIKKKQRKETINLAKCNTTTHADDVFCPLTLAWCINFLFNCPITLSNQKHDVYSILLVLKSGWWEFYSFDWYWNVSMCRRVKKVWFTECSSWVF